MIFVLLSRALFKFYTIVLSICIVFEDQKAVSNKPKYMLSTVMVST